MIVCDDPRFMFLHVPRTGGTALYRAIATALPPARIYCRDGRETHMAWWEAATRWLGYPVYCVMRSPWEIFASCYRLHQWYAELDPMPPQLACAEVFFRHVGHMSWPDWVREMVRTCHLCPPGGFSVRYAGPGVRVLQYAERPYLQLGELLGVKLEMPHINGHGAHPAWSAELAELVGRHCWRDVERFGYRPPISMNN